MADERQVQVKFSTQLPATLRVPATSFSVPAGLTRYGLSEVVNTLLGLGEFSSVAWLWTDCRTGDGTPAV